MSPEIQQSAVIKKEWVIYIVSSLLITLFLFFIDEGYYNFNWMTKVGNWIPFAVYAGAMLSGQLLLSRLFFRKYHGLGKTIASIFFGSAIGILFVIYVIFTKW